MLLLNCSGGSSGGGGAASDGGGGGVQLPQNCGYYCTNFLQEIDDDADGNDDAIERYTYVYIGSDRATGVIDYDDDAINPADRQIEIGYTNDYTNNELTIVERRQYPTAGTPDDLITTIWALDADGRRESGEREIAIDFQADVDPNKPTIDDFERITYTYNPSTGAMLKEEVDIDNGNDSIIDRQYNRTFTPTYDNGKILTNRIEYDSDNNGTIDERRTVTNTYANGLRTSKVVVIDRDGDNDDLIDDIHIIQNSTYSHDANGNEIEEVVIEDNDLDGNLDDTADSTWTNTWAYSKICSDTLSEPPNPLDWPI